MLSVNVLLNCILILESRHSVYVIQIINVLDKISIILRLVNIVCAEIILTIYNILIP